MRHAALTLLLSACQLSLKATPCETHAECRDAFGTGIVCGDDGYCGPVELPSRCSVWPTDALASPSPDDDTIWFGAQYEYSSDYIELLASELAFVQANARTGLDGRLFALVECDSSEDPALDDLDPLEATRAISLFQADQMGVQVVVGAEYSSRAEVAYTTLEPFGVALISPSASSPALTTIDGTTSTDAAPGLFWRTIPPDTDQGVAMAQELRERLGNGSVTVIAEAGAYGEGFARELLKAYDPSSARSTLRYFADSTDLSTAIVDTGASPPSVVIFITGEWARAADFLNAAGNIPAYAALPIFFTDGAKVEDLLGALTEAGRALLPNVRGTFPRTPTGRTTYQVFATSFRLEYSGYDPDSDSYTPYCYDAGWLALYGAAWSAYQEGDITGLGVARGLRRISDGPSVDVGPTTWTDVRARFRDGQGVDLNGSSGALDYDPETGETSAAVDIWVVEGAGFRVTHCWDLTSAPDPLCDGSPLE
mgnify:CR=1 FL=1